MPARCSAIAVTGPATPPPTISALVMTPARWRAIRRVLGSTLARRRGGAITRRCPSEGILGSQAPARRCTNVLSEPAGLPGLPEQLQFPGAGDRLGAVGHPELVQEVADVLLGGVQRHH